jgi:hypothetical protein
MFLFSRAEDWAVYFFRVAEVLAVFVLADLSSNTAFAVVRASHACLGWFRRNNLGNRTISVEVIHIRTSELAAVADFGARLFLGEALLVCLA